jgi:hypothetical protein
VEINAPPSVILGLTTSLKEKGQYILSLVNTTSGPVRPIRELIPVQDIVVKKLKFQGKPIRIQKSKGVREIARSINQETDLKSTSVSFRIIFP